MHTPQDHSKWAISETGTANAVCIGDLNRMESQERRGGGTVCMTIATMHHAFTNIVAKSDSC